MAGVGDIQILGYPTSVEDPDYRCWFPVGVPWFTTGTREPILAIGSASAYLLGFAVKFARFEYDISVTVGATTTHYVGSGSLSPMRIDLVTPPPTEKWFPFCTLFSSIASNADFTVAGWNSDSYDPITKLFYGTVFLEGAGLTTSAEFPNVPTSVVADVYGFPFTVYATPGTTATGLFTMEIAEFWEYQLADGTICRDAITGELKQDTPPSGL